MTLIRRFGYDLMLTRHPRGETVAGFHAIRLRGVGGFMLCFNSPPTGDLCMRVERSSSTTTRKP